MTHTNAVNGCNEGADYTLFYWEHDADSRDDRALANQLRQQVAPLIPGPLVIDQRTNLAELETNARWGDAYVELQFHSNQSRQTWLYNSSPAAAFSYGTAVDEYLGYP